MKRIESVKNPQVKNWKKLHTKKERDNTGLFLVEGFHLVEEALKAGTFVKELIVSENVEIPHHWNVDNLTMYLTTDSVMEAISDTPSPQGVAAICVQPREGSVQAGNLQRVLMIDAIQDPGNLGTIIRTADAAGIHAVILGEGTVDVYNSKVIRATQGSIFHLPIIRGSLGAWIQTMKNNEIPVYGTSLEGAEEYQKVEPQDKFALLVGNEGNGVNPEFLASTSRNLYIPIYGQSESLNVSVAAGILLYYLRR